MFDNINALPAAYFDDPRVIVEKFLPEMDGNLYCVNFYKFLGDEHLTQKLWSTKPVITGAGIVKRGTIDTDPDVMAIRHDLKIDYGKLDYCIYNGKPVLFDVNKTVGLSRIRRTPDEIARIHQRAEGIDCYFE